MDHRHSMSRSSARGVGWNVVQSGGMERGRVEWDVVEWDIVWRRAVNVNVNVCCMWQSVERERERESHVARLTNARLRSGT